MAAHTFEPTRPNKGLQPAVRGASLRSAPRPAAEAQVVVPARVLERVPRHAQVPRRTRMVRAHVACRTTAVSAR